ncbi:vacuolar protein sorting-associated protein 8 homolog [Neolamprologus brichardi]|uniref:vacuolar protein sorting-associated protein 8 homolog n=1 Tax=Neolamprologus brichardi TaxID=32507 RepID=UPI0003EC16FE|nr:vacuolar protein sorting-associated protein 8 homolog [Neolamprologus brichardi]
MSHSPDSHSLLSASSQLNLMEVDSIDDKEFDIPQVDTPPTLESILNELEDEEEPFVLEDTCILNTDNMDAHSCETSSLASSDSGDPSHLKRHALVGEKACYQSVSSYAGQIVYLGTKSAHIMTLRNWRERIDCLMKQEHFVEALSLAWSFHEGAAKAVVGLYGDSLKRKAVVSDKMIEILFQFAEHALKKCPEQGKIQVMEQHFQAEPIHLSEKAYFRLFDLLFNQLYSRLVENMVAKAVFLESLESYVVADRVGHLTPAIMRDLLDHYHSNGMMDSLERCIVHLDVTSLDIQQVVQVCWENQLYDAMIYVFNSGMNDYITPMEKLFAVIGPTLKEGRSLTDENVVMGNKLLVYISCCLAGRAYPLGDIPEDLVVQVKNQVFDFLIRLHSADSSEEEDVFPFIRTLLHFDTREFLNVLAMVRLKIWVFILFVFVCV